MPDKTNGFDTKPTLFLDVDSTVVVTNSGKDFPSNPQDWKFNGKILDYIVAAVVEGYQIVFVSNQAGVINGYLRPNDAASRLDCILMNIRRFVFEATRVKHTFTLFAPMSSDNAFYKGDNTIAGAYLASVQYDPIRSIMVGDADSKETSFSDSDKVFAKTLDLAMFYHPNALFELGLSNFKQQLVKLLDV